MSGEVYITTFSAEDSLFLRISRPGQTPEDHRLSPERKAYLVAALGASLQEDFQRAAAVKAARIREWDARDVAAS